MTIQLEEKSIELNGKTYVLRINMSVLERIQETVGGDINTLLERSLYDSMTVTMTAMLNDWAEDQGWEEEWTEKKVKKTFNPAMMNMLDVTGMFFRAMSPVDPKAAEKATEPNSEDPGQKSGN